MVITGACLINVNNFKQVLMTASTYDQQLWLIINLDHPYFVPLRGEDRGGR